MRSGKYVGAISFGNQKGTVLGQWMHLCVTMLYHDDT